MIDSKIVMLNMTKPNPIRKKEENYQPYWIITMMQEIFQKSFE